MLKRWSVETARETLSVKGGEREREREIGRSRKKGSIFHGLMTTVKLRVVDSFWHLRLPRSIWPLCQFPFLRRLSVWRHLLRCRPHFAFSLLRLSSLPFIIATAAASFRKLLSTGAGKSGGERFSLSATAAHTPSHPIIWVHQLRYSENSSPRSY